MFFQLLPSSRSSSSLQVILAGAGSLGEMTKVVAAAGCSEPSHSIISRKRQMEGG